MTAAYNDIVMVPAFTAPTARRFAQLAAPAGACAYVLSFAIPAKTDYSLLIFAALGAVALLAADGAAAGRRSRLLALAIACFCAVTLSSLVASVDLGRSLVASSALLPALLLFAIIGYGFSSLAEARTLLLVLSVVALGLALALIAITLRLGGMPATEWMTALQSPILVVPNDVTLLAVLLPAYLLPWRREPRSAAAVAGALAAAATLVACVALQSRTALLTALVALAALALLWRSRPLLIVTLTTPIVALGFDQLMLGGHLTAGLPALWDTRLALWATAWQMFVDAPMVGHGPNTFGALYLPYVAALDLRGILPADGRIIPWPHNFYLELLAERGIAGLAAFLAVLGVAARIGWRLRATANSETWLLATTVLASLAGIAFAGLLELTLLRLWVVVLIFVLLGLLQFLARRHEGSIAEATT